jgi:hypothetical protein
LPTPLGVVFVNGVGPYEEHIDIGFRAAIATSRRTKDGGRVRRDSPSRDLVTDSIKELGAEPREGHDRWCGDMISVERIQQGWRGFLHGYQALIYKPVQHSPNSRPTSAPYQSAHFTPGERASRTHQDH